MGGRFAACTMLRTTLLPYAALTPLCLPPRNWEQKPMVGLHECAHADLVRLPDWLSSPSSCCSALLDLDFEDAERIEREVAEQSAFSI